MKIAFDLDGTLYDTLPLLLKVDFDVRKELGYPEITTEEYRRHFQSRDWKQFYRDLGIREEHLEYMIDEFYRRFKLENPPEMIPGAREVLERVEEALGHTNIFIVTNERPERVRIRFERDGLMHYIDRLDTPLEGKAKELHKLATINNGGPFYYIGDIVSDGEDCRIARYMGASNIRFGGLIHQYAISGEKLMRQFVDKNKDFAQVLHELSDVERIVLNHRRH